MRTFGLKAEGDFSHVVKRCQRHGTGWQQRADGGRQRRDQRLRHAADVEAVVADGDARLAILGGLRPKIFPNPIHFLEIKSYRVGQIPSKEKIEIP